MERNRYGQYFKSAVDYRISYFFEHVSPSGIVQDGRFIKTSGYSTSINTRRIMSRKPSKQEVLKNVKNLFSWGLKVDIDHDLILSKDGALITLIDEGDTIDNLVKRNLLVRELVEHGYELTIGDGYLETPIYPGYEEIETNRIASKQKNEKAPKNGLYCTNFRDFLIEPEKVEYTDMANFLKTVIKKEPISTKESTNKKVKR